MLVGFVLTMVLIAVAIVGLGARRATDPRGAEEKRDFATDNPVERGCALERTLLARIQRGHDPVRSEDVTIVPRWPNFIGTFTLTSHSGPWGYLQRVPLILYGPGYIRPHSKRLDRAVESADVYPTIGELAGVDLPPRHGEALEEALDPDRSGTPKLVLTIVWDGAGRNTLARWPGAWPTLRKLERAGSSYANATVGSSPTITSAVHSTLGTGSLPHDHGIVGNDLRTKDGSFVKAFSGLASKELRLTTFADEVDRILGNAPKVGVFGWKNWHLGMMGHGASVPGGDRDEVALVKFDDGLKIFGNNDLFEVTDIQPRESLKHHLERVDRADGELDDSWMEHDISVEGPIRWTTYTNPAWASLQADMLKVLMKQGEYGRDDVPDLLFTNFKMTDLAAHQWSIDAPETRAVIKAQDNALADLIDYLNREVGDYVVVFTADHGAAPLPKNTGAWPIQQGELLSDLGAHFHVPEGRSLVSASAAFGYHLNRDIAAELGVTADNVAEFLNGYTIGDNWDPQRLPEGYERRRSEQVFSAAFPSQSLDEIGRCAAARDG